MVPVFVQKEDKLQMIVELALTEMNVRNGDFVTSNAKTLTDPIHVHACQAIQYSSDLVVWL